MKKENLKEAIAEAKRFLKKANELKNSNDMDSWRGSSKKASVKRSSLDLYKSLAKLRNDK